MNLRRIRRQLLSPLTRIAFGLVMLTVSLLLASDMLGIFPNKNQSELELRKYVAESLALQTTVGINQEDQDRLQLLFEFVLQRNERIKSVALIDSEGERVAIAGSHDVQWQRSMESKSAFGHTSVEIYSQDRKWGELQLVFAEPPSNLGKGSLILLSLYLSLSGFVGYFLFLRRVLKQLDPDQVLPDRVRSALDTLSEGLMIIDNKGEILFCNLSLASRLGVDAQELAGMDAASLQWHPGIVEESEDLVCMDKADLPWQQVLDGRHVEQAFPMTLQASEQQLFKFAVNTSTIVSEENKTRGALVTFSDITEIEKQRNDLRSTLVALEITQSEISLKNEELYKLATRDPLTDVLNRRAFFESFDERFEEAVSAGTYLGCIMVDIDKFKRVNDNYGHAMGDTIIQYLASVMVHFAGDEDVVGRFGGEEFCMLLPGKTLEESSERADQMRIHIEESRGATYKDTLTITSSFGVSCLPGDALTPQQLLDLADKALYFAKENGRNQVGMFLDGDIKRYGDLPAEVSQEAVATDSAIAESESVSQQSVAPASDRPERRARPVTEESSESGAQVLYEESLLVTKRHLLVYHIDKEIKYARDNTSFVAVLILNSTVLLDIYRSVGEQVGAQLSTALIDRLKFQLRPSDLISQPLTDAITKKTEQQSNHDEQSIEQTRNRLVSDMVSAKSSEIAILVSNIGSENDVSTIVERIRSAVDKPFSANGNTYRLNAAIGVSITGYDGGNSTQMLQNANIACETAGKSAALTQVVFYSKTLNRQAEFERLLKEDLPEAVANDQLRLQYQPKFDARTGQLAGLEALMRWKHPSLGEISAKDFLSLAKRLGLLTKLSRWSVCHAMDQLLSWQSDGNVNQTIALNLSADDLRDADLADFLIGELESRQLLPSAIEFEFTETDGLKNDEIAASILLRLRDYGFSIAIDDFGTGHASLGCLEIFPVNRIKIDKEFVRSVDSDIRKQRLVKAVIAIGASLNIDVLAEGVESRSEMAFLQAHGCDQLQGFLLGHPLEPAQLTELIGKGYAGNSTVTESVEALGTVPTKERSKSASGRSDFVATRSRRSSSVDTRPLAKGFTPFAGEGESRLRITGLSGQVVSDPALNVADSMKTENQADGSDDTVISISADGAQRTGT